MDNSDQMLIEFLREDSDDALLGSSSAPLPSSAAAVAAATNNNNNTNINNKLKYSSSSSSNRLSKSALVQAHLLSDEPLEGEINVPLSPPPGHRHDDVNIETTANVEGNINLHDFNTLDEPVKATVIRDLKAVGKKFMHVLYPRESRSLLKEWDLWGPLMLCIYLAVILHGDSSSSSSSSSSSNDSSGPQFAEVFIVYWIGAAVVTLNIKLLGGSISIFQGVCVLGYCVLPLALAALVCSLLLVAGDNTFIFVVRCLFVFVSLVWSVFASTAFLANCQPPRRKVLAVYPIFLFYFFLSWIVLLNK